jgi:Ca2+-binding RTX toxin-like protein
MVVFGAAPIAVAGDERPTTSTGESVSLEGFDLGGETSGTSGTGWTMYDCDTGEVTDVFSHDTTCVRVRTSTSILGSNAWRYVYDPEGASTSACPNESSCMTIKYIYAGWSLVALDWYWYIDGQDRAPGDYWYRICTGTSSSSCTNVVDTHFEVLAPPPTCSGKDATIWGTEGDDTLTGTAGRDIIAGLDGDDVIKGLGGNDLICSGHGNDTVIAGPGNDNVIALGGDDYIDGGAGDDKLKGRGGADEIYGGDGYDVVMGQGGPDWLCGEADADITKGGMGPDYLDGGDGTDELYGSGGRDTCVAGELLDSC